MEQSSTTRSANCPRSGTGPPLCQAARAAAPADPACPSRRGRPCTASGPSRAQDGAQSGFAGTDLDFQRKLYGITHVIVVGLLANTCIESIGRFAGESGHHVTVVRDATRRLHRGQHAQDLVQALKNSRWRGLSERAAPRRAGPPP
ncbi:isochorismatase family protein, partial [Streptomyces flaveolus]|uniref:isochorismatase family protein n=1 Tax=Streptomyces flaveolus TaxID=67297 RepID=UPI00342D9C4E